MANWILPTHSLGRSAARRRRSTNYSESLPSRGEPVAIKCLLIVDTVEEKGEFWRAGGWNDNAIEVCTTCHCMGAYLFNTNPGSHDTNRTHQNQDQDQTNFLLRKTECGERLESEATFCSAQGKNWTNEKYESIMGLSNERKEDSLVESLVNLMAHTNQTS